MKTFLQITGTLFVLVCHSWMTLFFIGAAWSRQDWGPLIPTSFATGLAALMIWGIYNDLGD